MGDKLKGKVAIISGGAVGIGASISKRFASEGANVVVCGFCSEPVSKVVEEISAAGGEAFGYQGDISSEIKARECVTMTLNNFGKIDIFIGAAGILPPKQKIESYSLEAFHFIMRNNIQTAFMMTRFILPELKKTKGCIVFTGADAGIDGMSENAPYAGTKGFIHAFAKGLAAEQENSGVRINCISNEPLDTPWNAIRNNGNLFPEESIHSLSDEEKIVDSYLYLSGNDAKHLNGIIYSARESKQSGSTGKVADSRGAVKKEESSRDKNRKES